MLLLKPFLHIDCFLLILLLVFLLRVRADMAAGKIAFKYIVFGAVLEASISKILPVWIYIGVWHEHSSTVE